MKREGEVFDIPVVTMDSAHRHMVGLVGPGGTAVLDLETDTLHIFGPKGEYMGASDLEPSPPPDDA